MSFLRRLLGGDQPAPPAARGPAAASGAAAVNGAAAASRPAAASGPTADEVELERDRALARAEAERLSDELLARQMRYADRSWTPPAQGGSRRADDTEGTGAE